MEDLHFVYRYGCTCCVNAENLILGAKPTRKSLGAYATSSFRRNESLRRTKKKRGAKISSTFTYLRCLNDYFERNRWHVKRTEYSRCARARYESQTSEDRLKDFSFARERRNRLSLS